METTLEQQLKECEERYRSFSETSVDAIITSDENNTILTWNRGAEHIFQHGREIIGHPVTVIIPERLRERHLEGVRQFLESGEKHIIGKTVEMTALRKDGIEIPVELSLSSWKGYSGTLFGAIIRDISERRHIEGVREDIYRIMRHELKSPLVGVTGLGTYSALLVAKAHKGDIEFYTSREHGTNVVVYLPGDVENSRDNK